MTKRHAIIPALALAFTASAHAADVRLQTGGRQAFVGVPFPIAVSVTFESDHQPPTPPTIDNATVEDAGSSRSNRSVQITINGRQVRSENTVTYQYRITPTQPGVLRIPRIEVVADGETLQTQATAVQVSEIELGELMLLEVTASKDTVYVGEPVNVTLALWLKPYQQGNLQLDYQDMWSLVNDDVSDWGRFQEVIANKQVTARTSRRVNDEGNAVVYYVYELERIIWPERPGELDVGDVRVIAEYPLHLTRDRSMSFFMSGGLRVAQSKPIAATIGDMPVTVKPIPEQGRPPYYQGAVGSADITASAAPTSARVGDPITLNLTIKGGGRLETLQAPRLADLPELTERFHVADDPLPGIIQDDTKRFTQSIRALSEDVTEIPPIPYAYFDPQQERFVTVHTDPIPLDIEAAERMSTAQIVEGGSERVGGSNRLTRLSRGIEANYTDVDDLLAQQRFQPDGTVAAIAAGAPLVYFACALGMRRRRRLLHDVSGRRRRNARKSALAHLRQGQDDPAVAAQALLGYIADRWDLPAGGLTRAEAVGRLQSARIDPEIVQQTDDLLCACEAAEFGGAATAGALAPQVEALIGRIEKS